MPKRTRWRWREPPGDDVTQLTPNVITPLSLSPPPFLVRDSNPLPLLSLIHFTTYILR